VPLPGNKPYTYCVGKAASAIKEDVLALARAEADKRGIGIGFYYSMTNNFFMKVAHLHANPGAATLPGQVPDLEQADYERIAIAQLRELWTNYGNLTELWFDGTYPVDLHATIKDLILSKQPDAVVWNGLGMYSATADNRISNSGIRWIGTESGLPGGDIWSTAKLSGDFSGKGDPDSPVFAPAGVDFTVQSPSHWFFTPPGSAVLSLGGLVQRYHEAVGRNGVIEMDFAINRDGLVQPEHAALYKGFGDWLKSCYGGPPTFAGQAAASTTAVLTASASTLVLAAPAGSTLAIDRVMLQEDQADGQRVRTFEVQYLGAGGAWLPLSAGASVGNKRIDLLGKTVSAAQFRLTVTKAAAWPVSITNFAVFKHCLAPK